MSEYKLENTTLSSSLIRQKIAEGDMKTVTALLGREYSLTSTVVDGQHLARKLGFPTVNICPEPSKILPKNGVYVTRIRFDGEIWYGITNTGVRPTVDTKITCAETHIFDFDGNLYGKQITVEFLEFIRPEQKFPCIEAMAEQIKRDIVKAREYVEKLL